MSKSTNQAIYSKEGTWVAFPLFIVDQMELFMLSEDCQDVHTQMALDKMESQCCLLLLLL